MKIYAYQSPHGNLGDDLNLWLWPRVLRADFLKRQAVFMGIGSVIHANHLKTLPPHLPLIIFGAGCRSASDPFESLEIKPQISMVRGPLSAKALHIHPDYAGLDAAYALQFTEEYKSLLSLPKRRELTLIPYFRSGPLVHYGFIKKTKGWNLLRSDRYGSIPNALRTIAESKFILTESLHGAILADSLRVPWMRLWYYLERAQDKETGEFKWADWQQSLKIGHIPTLRIPLDFPQWVAGRKGRLLRPWRTLRYFQHARIKKEFTLSAETFWRERSQFLEDRLQSVQQ
jgi:succinoglycan biosynthesis protein ExoV